jgi:hypothetical protein
LNSTGIQKIPPLAPPKSIRSILLISLEVRGIIKQREGEIEYLCYDLPMKHCNHSAIYQPSLKMSIQTLFGKISKSGDGAIMNATERAVNMEGQRYRRTENSE